jgi:hypothetical protein
MVLKYVTKNGVRYHQLDRKSADIVKVVPPSPMPLSGSGTCVGGLQPYTNGFANLLQA